MRLASLAIFAAVLLVNSNAVSTELPKAGSSAFSLSATATHADNVVAAKRSLRTNESPDESDDYESEERGLKQKLLFWKWFKRGETPKSIYKKLGLEELGENAIKDKNYKKYLKFSTYWKIYNFEFKFKIAYENTKGMNPT